MSDVRGPASCCSASRAPARARRPRASPTTTASSTSRPATLFRAAVAAGHAGRARGQGVHGPRRARPRRDRDPGGRGALRRPAASSTTASSSTASRARWQQAEELERVLADHPLDLVIDLDVPTEIVLDRIAGRRVCENCGATYHVNMPPTVNWTCDVCGGEVVQRDDDTEEAIGRRLELYEQRDQADHRLLPAASASWSWSTASATGTRCSSASGQRDRRALRPCRVDGDHAQERRSRSRSMRRAGRVVAEMHEVCIRAAEAGRDHARRRPRSRARCSSGAAPARTSSATTGSPR